MKDDGHCHPIFNKRLGYRLWFWMEFDVRMLTLQLTVVTNSNVVLPSLNLTDCNIIIICIWVESENTPNSSCYTRRDSS